MVIFLYNLYIFVWIWHSCLTYMVSALDPNCCVIKRLWCTSLLYKLSFLLLEFKFFPCREEPFPRRAVCSWETKMPKRLSPLLKYVYSSFFHNHTCNQLFWSKKLVNLARQLPQKMFPIHEYFWISLPLGREKFTVTRPSKFLAQKKYSYRCCFIKEWTFLEIKSSIKLGSF